MTHPNYPYRGYSPDRTEYRPTPGGYSAARESADYPYTYPTYDPQQGWIQPGYGPPTPPPPPPRTRSRRLASLAGVAALAAALVIGIGVGHATTDTNGTGTAIQQSPTSGSGNTGNGNTGNGNTVPTVPTNPGNGQLPNGNNSSTQSAQATDQQQIGVVDIYTKLKYQQAAAAGTGMVLTSDGYILTNNHVIEGSTSIRVIVVSTGKSYVAKVVGTAPTEDIAVLKVSNASGLQPANFGNSASVKVGDSVTGVGNAGGTGGTPSAASGKVTALDQSITASDESGTNPEKLSNVIVTDAPIQSGDSGGPLYNADDEIIGIDTAASTSGRSAGFAIPINKALDLAQQIRTGTETSVIHIGYPAFLGVSVKNSGGNGALIYTTENGLPADKAGIVPGDVVTSLAGSKVTSANSLRAAIAKVQPGDTVTIEYTDANGASHTTQATLITGPAD